MVMQPPVDAGVIRRTVQDVPNATVDDPAPLAGGGGGPFGELYLYSIAQFADEMVPWGYLTRLRDIQLREWLPSENVLSSAFSTMAARNAAFSWRLDGGDRLVQRAQDVLQYANMGAGYRDFITRFTFDFAGQDNGAFVEVVRETDRPWSRCIGLNTLDAGRCWRTGDPLNPVLYTSIEGKRHLMRYDQVIPFTEMPSNIERLRGIQISAMTRALRAAQLWRDITQFHREKMGGRRPLALHFVNNVSTKALDDVMLKAQARADNLGLYRFMEPLIVEGLKPGEAISTATIELASLPANFDHSEFWVQYIAQLAMALLMDYMDLAPLPGGNIGTATQAQVLSEKTRGKGPGLFMKKLEDAFNFYGVFGQGVTFSFDEQDLTQDQQAATVDKTRAEGRAAYINSGVLTPAIVRQQMVDNDELDEEYLQMLAEEDVTDESTTTDSAPIDTAAEVTNVANDVVPAQPVAPAAPAAPAPNPLATIGPAKALDVKAGSPAVIKRDPLHQEMDDTEAASREAMAAALHKTRGTFIKDIQRKVSRKEPPIVTEVKAIAAASQAVIDQKVHEVKVEVKAASEDMKEAVTAAVTESTRALVESQQTLFELTAAQTAATIESGRKKRVRKTIIRNDLGIIQDIIEEEI